MNKSIIHKLLLKFLAVTIAIVIIASCNKNLPEAVPIEAPGTGGSTQTIAEFFATDTNYSFYNAALAKAASFGLAVSFNNKDARYTVFAPDNNAFRRSGISSEAVVTGGFRAGQLDSLLRYSIIPGEVYKSSDITTAFPNIQLASNLTVAAIPGTILPLNLSLYPSKSATGFYLNNIPVVAADNILANGVVHTPLIIAAPPTKYLWNRINTDTELTYYKAAVLRADTDPSAPGALQAGLLNIGANLTVFAPVDAALRPVLFGALYQGILPQVIQQLIAGGATPEQAAAAAPPIAAAKASTLSSTPDGFNQLPVQTVKGIVVYHILGVKAYTNNFPTDTISYPTLLNGGLPQHPGVKLKATFAGPFATNAIVKGYGNATASNIMINTTPFTPEPFGTSDQNYLNGVLHKIDQVLLPQ